MTVAAQSPINSYVGTGLANTFPFTFPVFKSSELAVTVVGSGASTLLVLLTDYTVIGLNAAGSPASAGSIVLVNAGQSWLSGGNLATGFTLTVQSNFPYAQPTSIRNQGDFFQAALEDALDRLEYQIQQLNLNASQPIYVDIVTGFTYRIVFVNGVMSQQRLT